MPCMPIFVVQYTYDERRAERDVTRPEHRRFLGSLEADGVLLASGPYAGPPLGPGVTGAEQPGSASDGATQPDGALLIVRADSAAAVLSVLDADPFAREGLISDRGVRAWTPVFGPWA